MIHPPPSVYEAWPAPNYVDPPTRGSVLLVLDVILVILCICAVSARLYSRLYIMWSPGLDDLMIVLAVIPTIGLSVLVPIGVYQYGWNRHVWDIPEDLWAPSRKISWIAQSLFLFSTCTVRVSILLFYRRVTMHTMERAFLWTVYAAIAFIVAYAVSFYTVLLTGCRPLHSYWDQVNPYYTEPYSCYNESVDLPASAFIACFVDLFVVALPGYLVYSMRMPIRQKLSLIALFSVGLIVCAAGALRTYEIWEVSHTYDETWTGYYVWLWTFVENDLAIICSCVPAFKPFFKKYLNNNPPPGADEESSRARRRKHAANIANNYSSNTECSSGTDSGGSARTAMQDITTQDLKGDSRSGTSDGLTFITMKEWS